MRSLIFISIFILISLQTISQALQRRAFLGVKVENVSDLGIQVVKVFDGGSGAMMGIQNNDIILSLDGENVSSVDYFITSLGERFEGDEIVLNLSRDEKEIKIIGTLLGRPKEEPNVGSVIYGSVEFENGRLRTILNLPVGIENPPVFFFIQGYSCRTIDIYWDDKNRLRRIVDGMVSNGFAVYRIEKPGMGDSQTLKDCDEIGYHEESAAFLAGLRGLKASGKVDIDRVYLFGHSLGGITAPVIATQEKVKGIINYGSVTSSWFEFLVKRAREHGRLREDNPVDVESNARNLIPFLKDYLIDKMDEKELSEKYADYFAVHNTPYLAGRDYTFMQELEDVNITQCLIDCNAHVLAIHAEADFNCIDDNWAKHTAYIVNSVRPGYGQWKLLPKTSHSFAKVGDLSTFMDMRTNGEITSSFVDANFNPALIDMIVEWITEVENS